MAVPRHLPIIKLLEAFIGHSVYVYTATAQIEWQHSVNRASTRRQQRLNRVPTLVGVASFIIHGLRDGTCQ